MKTRLPKALLLAVLAAPVMADTLTSDNVDSSTRVLDVGLGTATDTWNGDITVGTWGDSIGDAAAIGALNGSSMYASSQLGASKYTDTLTVTGSVTVQGEGKIVLGGKQNSKQYGGIIANQVTVGTAVTEETHGPSDAPTLFASMCNIANLEVNSGTVEMGGGSDCYTGNSSMSETGKKLAQITHSLTVNGGTVTLGQYQSSYYSAEHAQTALGRVEGATFKAATITQSKGDIVAKGYTLTASGLKINQTGGTMEFQGPLAFFGQLIGTDSTTAIEQDATTQNTKLVINGMVEPSYSFLNQGCKPNSMAINIFQKGVGTIELKNGIQISTSSVGLISQEGDGIINLSGEFTPKFNIEQKASGTIKLKENAKMTAGTVKLMDSNVTHPDAEKGGLVVEKGASLTAESITIDGGKLVNNGTVKGNITIGAVAETFSVRSTEVDVVTGELKNSGTINGDVLVQGGTLIADSGSKFLGKVEVEGGTLEVDADATMSAGLKMDDASTLIFAEGTTIDLGTSDLELADGVEIAVTLTDADIENLSGVTLFTSADEKDADWGSYKVAVLDSTGKDTGKKAVLNYNAGGDVTLESVPEPTTATLSLLALAALASRRRRK